VKVSPFRITCGFVASQPSETSRATNGPAAVALVACTTCEACVQELTPQLPHHSAKKPW
jgi:hypothetical protein